MQRQYRLTLLFLTLTIAAALAAGALIVRQNYLTRGIPDPLPGPITGGGVTFGVNVALEQYDNAELTTNLQTIKALGIDHVKQSFYFTESFDWQAADRLVTAVAYADLTLTPLLDGDPATQFKQPDTAVYAAWAGAFAARYGDAIDHYIIWDEPNISAHWGGQDVNAIEYAALLTAAAAAIRAADSDAQIVAAPLAPTVETGPRNVADHLYLQRLYEAGAAPAFDIAAAKPYGFNTGPDDRRVANDVLNVSRVILVREVMQRNGDGYKAIWGGNWGWNALPPNWDGTPSIWGEATLVQQGEWTLDMLLRAQREWPWMGRMFLENWEPNAPANDPRWGFSMKENIGDWGLEIGDFASASNLQAPTATPPAMPGFHFATPADPNQVYTGGWEFSPEFGADISEVGPEETPDTVTFTFWGTSVGLRVRRANFRARLYVTVDGQPANALPRDENGSTLVLTAPDPTADYLTIIPIARDLEPGVHTVEIVAARGWDQWALNGFSVGYQPPDGAYQAALAALGLAIGIFGFFTVRSGRRATWRPLVGRWHGRYQSLKQWQQGALTAVLAAFVALSGWLTWGAEAAGIYRRLGDAGQLALTAGAAAVFYVAPSFIITLLALAALWLLLTFRPAWGLALIAFSAPFYVLPKPMLGYLFSPVEVFTLVALAAVVSHQWSVISKEWTANLNSPRHSPLTAHRLRLTDYAVLAFVAIATLSLLFTNRLDVATNEWRVVVVEPALFYLMWRLIRPSRQELWTILDAFVLGGVVVALYGLGQYVFAPEQLIAAEGGLLRLRAFYGSPNNVALYLDRIVPLLAAILLLSGTAGNSRRRWLYGAALLPVGLAFLLTFSRGGILLGLPAGLLFVFWRWQVGNGRRTWPWLLAFGAAAATAYGVTLQIPQLAGRLDPSGATNSFRLNLWQSSLEMIRENPLLGVGLDNFLYEYRGRYILERAWQEPNLNHPHNILFDFATRLGLVGLLAGGWLWALTGRRLWQATAQVDAELRPIAVGLGGTFAASVAHGLVDHSFFLVDLAFAFYLLLGVAVWLTTTADEKRP